MKKTIAVFLSAFVLISSFNYCLSAHYCGQNLIDIAFFGDAEACLMESEMDNGSERSCCSDRDILIEGENYLASKSFSKKEVKKIESLITELEYPIELLKQNDILVFQDRSYVPPLIEKDIPILVQSFLL